MRTIVLIFLLILGTSRAFAMRMESGDDVTIRQAVQEDLYVAGGTVTINAPIYGDLIVAGGTVTINDTVTQDIMLAGGTVIFNGYVGDDIRCVGGTLRLSKLVRGDVIMSGGTLDMDKDATIAGNLVLSGGNAVVNGTVSQALKAACGSFVLNGTVGKNLDVRGGKIAIHGTVGGTSVLAGETIDMGSGARFLQDVRYWNQRGTIDFSKAMVHGKASFDPSLSIEGGSWKWMGFASALLLVWYLAAALLLLFLVQYLFGTSLKKAAQAARTDVIKSVGYGFLFVVAVPVAIALIFATLIGIPVALILLAGYGILVALASVITAGVGANWINEQYKEGRWHTATLVLVAFGLFLVLKAISAIPFVGWLTLLVLVCLAFGSILRTFNAAKAKEPASREMVNG